MVTDAGYVANSYGNRFFFSRLVEYDNAYNFPFYWETNGLLFGSKKNDRIAFNSFQTIAFLSIQRQTESYFVPQLCRVL